MYNSFDKELDILAFLFNNKSYFAQHKDMFAKFPFYDKRVTLVFQHTKSLVDSFGEFPTESELKTSLTSFMETKFPPLEIQEACEIATEVMNRKTTAVTSKNLDEWLIYQEKTRIAEELMKLEPAQIASKLNDIERQLQQLNLLHFDKDDLGCDLFSTSGIKETISQIEAYHKELCIPSTFTLLDEKLEGGFRKGEICLILAPPNAGKTLFLVNAAARFVKQGFRTVYLALDNIKAEMKNRLLSVFLEQGIDPTSATYDGGELEKELTSAYGAFDGKFIIKHYAPQELTKGVIERYLNKLRIAMKAKDLAAGVPEDKAGVIDVLIIDYFELMRSESSNGEFWIQAEHLAQEMKAVALKHNLFLLSATQGGTEAMKSETVQMWQAAGAKSRFNQPDLVFSLSSTLQEKLMPVPVLRLTNLKARRKSTHYQIRMRFDKLKHKIYEDPNQTSASMVNNTDKASEAEANPDKTFDTTFGKYIKKKPIPKAELDQAQAVVDKVVDEIAQAAKEVGIEEKETEEAFFI